MKAFGLKLFAILTVMVSSSWSLRGACLLNQYDILEPDTLWAKTLKIQLDELLESEWFEKTQVGLCVYDLSSDTMLYARNIHQRMRPASTQKLLTAITALDKLGGAYQFQTRLCYTGCVENRILYGDLYAIGGFDPRFAKDDMQAFVNAVTALAVDSVAGCLYADVSMKDTLKWGYGWCWDDDMPVLTPLLYKGQDRFVDKLIEMLSEAGVGVRTTAYGQCPSEAETLSVRKHAIDQVLMPMMKESDNLYAESLFYQLGALSGKPYASYKNARRFVLDLMDKLHVTAENALVADGSGVSLYNYLTPAVQIAFLRYAYHNEEIFLHLYASLPVAGVDGTLRNRMKRGAAYRNVHAKTGTLEGVISLAGYAMADNGHRLAFCILNQGVDSSKKARDFQDKVCTLLCR